MYYLKHFFNSIFQYEHVSFPTFWLPKTGLGKKDLILCNKNAALELKWKPLDHIGCVKACFKAKVHLIDPCGSLCYKDNVARIYWESDTLFFDSTYTHIGVPAKHGWIFLVLLISKDVKVSNYFSMTGSFLLWNVMLLNWFLTLNSKFFPLLYLCITVGYFSILSALGRLYNWVANVTEYTYNLL